jgi:agmatinase
MISLPTEQNFLGIEDESLCSYDTSRFVIQPVPYEHTSSYLQGSSKGPQAIIDASHFVEFYDEELDTETLTDIGGIATLPALDFKGKIDREAVDFIDQKTTELINGGKFVVSFGAEHTVTYGFVKAHARKYPDLCVLQLDAHSDLRAQYHGNPYSHASVMARVHDEGLSITQIGIRAQCSEEAQLIKSSPLISTFYAHKIRKNPDWKKEALATLKENVYLTIDADGFDPSIMPAVGTAEPGGLFWEETLDFLRLVAKNRNIVGFDIVEVAPFDVPGQTLSEYTLAKLAYRIIGYIAAGKRLPDQVKP